MNTVELAELIGQRTRGQLTENERLICQLAATVYGSVKMCVEPEKVAVKVALEIMHEVSKL